MIGDLTPDMPTLCKLGSIIVHAEELLSPDGHEFDKVALDMLLKDKQVQSWLKTMRKTCKSPHARAKRVPAE